MVKIQDELDEKQKELRALQLGLREFLQRNIEALPSKFFEQIEDIILGNRPKYEGPRYRNQQRRMADTYK